MTDRQKAVLTQIDHAFDGVVLGEGTGLLEAYAMDENLFGAELQQVRERDEKLDWRKLIDPQDPRTFGNLAINARVHMNPEGLRFHMPAFMSLVVQYPEQDCDLSFYMINFLTGLTEHNLCDFEIFHDAQRAAISEFLTYLADDYQYYGEQPNDDPRDFNQRDDYETLKAAIRDYWSQPGRF